MISQSHESINATWTMSSQSHMLGLEQIRNASSSDTEESGSRETTEESEYKEYDWGGDSESDVRKCV